MPQYAKVQIHYGPYEAAGIVEHRTSRLEGLQTILQRGGHTTTLHCINDRNVVELWVNGELVFQCDIRDLEYGGDGELDPLCADAAKAVTRAF
ncbi:hypothetical protein C0Q70_01275 [Pomacea canaliculata]|uniref:Uncharacterized protein n=2 Tax=Pomacea canaliculata TaxID=400727 RepID=A0A2T7PZ34_POMCA|nr:hypothetical protein C0Q70_01275 [Pomacea canaliculata]